MMFSSSLRSSGDKQKENSVPDTLPISKAIAALQHQRHSVEAIMNDHALVGVSMKQQPGAALLAQKP